LFTVFSKKTVNRTTGAGIYTVDTFVSSRLTVSTVLPALRAERARRNRLEDLVVSFFDQFRDPLVRYLSGFGLTFPDCEEVLQEVFLSLFQHLDRGKSSDNIRGWLFRVAHNLALKKRMRTRETFEVQEEAELAIDPSPNPEDQVVNRQTRQRLLAVVDALPEQDRRCLFLRAEGLRYREIAEILDMSLGAVSISLARSLARIARSAER
jgi:RNA polymerase sigma-70 factor (ECF subfamily)